MPAALIDTHCHLHLDPLHGALDDVLARARAAGVVGCLTLATSLASARPTLAMARQHPMVRVALGIHPEEVDGATSATVAEIESLLDDPALAAIGEVGLDDYWRQDRLDAQASLLQQLFALAARRRLPACIHCRGCDAYDRLLAVLRAAPQPVRGVIHCASGSPEFIRAALALGLHVSFAGNVTFPNAAAIRELVAVVPDDRLLIETDAPFLAPQAVRGQKNEPAFVAHTAAFVAQLRGVDVATLAALTTRNAQALFGFTVSAL
jgi:TatD DNase family protein